MSVALARFVGMSRVSPNALSNHENANPLELDSAMVVI
jgi:hypothetical protein